MKIDEMTLDIEHSVEVAGKIEEVFRSVIHRFGEGNIRPDGVPMDMKLEEWAGGRWYRDRGEGIQHLWGHVQVIKPPTLVELSGPMFMSYPALNHLELKLEETSSGTRVTLRHRAIGMLDPQHREGVTEGWKSFLDLVEKDFSNTAATRA